MKKALFDYDSRTNVPSNFERQSIFLKHDSSYKIAIKKSFSRKKIATKKLSPRMKIATKKSFPRKKITSPSTKSCSESF